jgi:hypothetical protein
VHLPLQQVPRLHHRHGQQRPRRRPEEATQAQIVQEASETESTAKEMYLSINFRISAEIAFKRNRVNLPVKDGLFIIAWENIVMAEGDIKEREQILRVHKRCHQIAGGSTVYLTQSIKK